MLDFGRVARCSASQTVPTDWVKETLGTKQKGGLKFCFCQLFRGQPCSQMKDERPLAFYKNVRQQVALDAESHWLDGAYFRLLSTFSK
jgi:hypothetical protein